jgi:hypothetical protein
MKGKVAIVIMVIDDGGEMRYRDTATMIIVVDSAEREVLYR